MGRYEQEKANAAYYLRNGRCPECGGKRDVVPGLQVCEVCREKKNTRNRELRKLWREQGKCSHCGGELAGDGKRTCLRCRGKAMANKEVKAQKTHWRRDSLIMRGMCAQCGRTWAEAGKQMCAKCAEKRAGYNKKYDPNAEKKRARREARIAAGLCIDCGAPTEGLKRCPRCTAARRDSTRKYKIMQNIKREAEQARRASV